MLTYTLTVLSTVITMLLLIAFGYFLYKKKYLDDNGADQLSNILLKFITPALTITAYDRAFNKDTALLLAQSFLFAAISIGISIIYARVSYPTSTENWQEKNLGTVFTNNGFMALPLLQVLFSDLGVFLGSAYMSISNILLWIYGLKILLGDKYRFNYKSLLVNPGLIAISTGMLLFFTPLKLPVIIKSTLSLVGNLYTPLAMIILGAFLARTNIASIFKDIKMHIYSIGVMLVLPIIVVVVFLLLPIDSAIAKSVVVVGIACPSGATTPMIAAIYGKDPSYMSRLISITTLYSIVTLPIILTLFEYLIKI